MERLKTKSLERIEKRMDDVKEDTLRYRVLESAKNFKISWVELGQSLYTVWKDKSYKEWGYLTFEAYTSKEIGIKKPTAMKLLKSYYFLEKEEPVYLQRTLATNDNPAAMPSYEAVNVLRLAKNKSILDQEGYNRFKKDVLEAGKDASVVKKDLTQLMRQREELEPEEAREKKRTAVIKRLVSSLKTLKSELESSKMLPGPILKELSGLIHKVELEIPS